MRLCWNKKLRDVPTLLRHGMKLHFVFQCPCYLKSMKQIFACFAFILALAGELISNAAVLRPMPLEELSAKADVIIHGRVTSMTCQRDTSGQIYTSVTLAIEEVWKGKIDTNTFRIVHSGGILGDQIETCSAQVEYKIGEEIVAMLVLNQRGEGVTLGLLQGKFEVATDAKTGEKLVHNLFHGRYEAELHAGSNPTPSPNIPSNKGRLKLIELKKQVKGGTQ